MNADYILTFEDNCLYTGKRITIPVRVRDFLKIEQAVRDYLIFKKIHERQSLLGGRHGKRRADYGYGKGLRCMAAVSGAASGCGFLLSSGKESDETYALKTAACVLPCCFPVPCSAQWLHGTFKISVNTVLLLCLK